MHRLNEPIEMLRSQRTLCLEASLSAHVSLFQLDLLFVRQERPIRRERRAIREDVKIRAEDRVNHLTALLEAGPWAHGYITAAISSSGAILNSF